MARNALTCRVDLQGTLRTPNTTSAGSPMKTVLKIIFLVLLLPLFCFGQDEENFPPISYLRGDYRSVSVVAHVSVREAEITAKIGTGYENWKITSEVLEPFKGRVRKGQVIEYFQGVEAGAKREIFMGQKIIFLLAEYKADKKALRYSVLENSTLPHTEDRVRKLRIIRRSYAKRPRAKNASKRRPATIEYCSWPPTAY